LDKEHGEEGRKETLTSLADNMFAVVTGIRHTAVAVKQAFNIHSVIRLNNVI